MEPSVSPSTLTDACDTLWIRARKDQSALLSLVVEDVEDVEDVALEEVFSDFSGFDSVLPPESESDEDPLLDGVLLVLLFFP